MTTIHRNQGVAPSGCEDAGGGQGTVVTAADPGDVGGQAGAVGPAAVGRVLWLDARPPYICCPYSPIRRMFLLVPEARY